MGTKEIVPIIDDGEHQYVDARTLHGTLVVSRDFSTWIKDRIDKYGFEEYSDYVKLSPDLGSGFNGGQNKIDYQLSISMAKELAIVENNDRGREVRQYLIKVETAWNTPAMVMARALQCSSKMITEYKNQIEIMKPKVESFDALQRSEKTMSITQTAKYFKLHPKTEVFPYLRERKYLTTKDLPSQDALDAEILDIVKTKGRDNEMYDQTVVRDWMLEKWRKVVVPNIIKWEAEE